MNFRTTYILFGILIVEFGLFCLSWLFSIRPGEELYVMNDLRRANVKGKDITSVEIERRRPDTQKIVFQRDPETKKWKMTQPAASQIENDFAVDGLVNQIIDARKDEQATISSAGQSGLEPPAETVTLTGPEDKQYQFNVGDQTLGDQSNKLVYVSTGADPKRVLAVKRADIDSLFKKANEFRSRELLLPGALNAAGSTEAVDLRDAKGHELKLVKKAPRGEAKSDVKSDSDWRVEKPYTADADFDGEANPASGKITGVKELLNALSGINVAYNPDNKEDDFFADNVTDLARYGLEKGKPDYLRIEVTRKVGGGRDEGKERTVTEALLVGKPAEGKKDKYYARLEKENNIVLVSAKALEPVLKALDDPNGLRNRDLVNIEQPKIDALDIKSPDGSFKLRKSGFDAWKIYDDSGKPRTADRAEVTMLLNGLTVKRQVKDFPDPKTPEKDLGFTDKSPEVLIWSEGIKKEEPKKDDKDKKDEPKDKKDEAKKDEPKKEEARKDEPKDKKEEPKDKKEEPKKEEPKKEEPKEKEPALKDAQPTVTLIFGARVKDKEGKETKDVYVKRVVGKETTLLTIPDTVLDRVNAGKLAYLDRSLENFARDADVTRMVIVRPKDKEQVTYELEREKRDGKDVWTIKQPKELQGRSADPFKVNAIIGDLADLRAFKYVAEKGNPKELRNWGLDPARIQVTLTVRPAKKEEKKDEPKVEKKEEKKEEKKDEKKEEPKVETKDRVYLFGETAKDKDNLVYAKQGQHDMVFLVGPEKVRPLEGELLDLQVFKQLDPKKVTQVKLSWKPVDKKPVKLDLVRDEKEKTWSVNQKDLGEFMFDAGTLDRLLELLTVLKADKLLAIKGAAVGGYGLGANDRLLHMELTVEGEKEPLTFTIGKLQEKDKGYAATGGNLAGDVFLVPQDTFQKLIDGGVKYFGK
jgi:hypothetical protein